MFQRQDIGATVKGLDISAAKFIRCANTVKPKKAGDNVVIVCTYDTKNVELPNTTLWIQGNRDASQSNMSHGFLDENTEGTMTFDVKQQYKGFDCYHTIEMQAAAKTSLGRRLATEAGEVGTWQMQVPLSYKVEGEGGDGDVGEFAKDKEVTDVEEGTGEKSNAFLAMVIMTILSMF